MESREQNPFSDVKYLMKQLLGKSKEQTQNVVGKFWKETLEDQSKSQGKEDLMKTLIKRPRTKVRGIVPGFTGL